jgi:hypothetical protein
VARAAGYLIPAGLANWDEVKARYVQEWIIMSPNRPPFGSGHGHADVDGDPPETGPPCPTPSRAPGQFTELFEPVTAPQNAFLSAEGGR